MSRIWMICGDGGVRMVHAAELQPKNRIKPAVEPNLLKLSTPKKVGPQKRFASTPAPLQCGGNLEKTVRLVNGRHELSGHYRQRCGEHNHREQACFETNRRRQVQIW